MVIFAKFERCITRFDGYSPGKPFYTYSRQIHNAMEDNTKLKRQMTPQEIAETFDRKNVVVYYQPQFNHSTGQMIGAEALIRIDHPEFGIQSPVFFISDLESAGLIYEADLEVFTQVCAFLRHCLDSGLPVLPISFNLSRFDLYQHDFLSNFEEIRKSFDIPVKYLRAEITETAAIGGIVLLTSAINKLHSCGYFVEMDDFGSGYSTLNSLKNLPVDAIKLDMHFLSDDLNKRGGTIIKSIVQMAKWMNTPTIAEGVETVEQADFMKSIGCNYIQGYLYSKPLNEEDFVELLKKTSSESIAPIMNLSVDAIKFWTPDSYETLIFSQYVGPAAIFSYESGNVEILRINQKYIKELGMNLTEEDVVRSNPWDNLSDDARRIYEETIKRAIAREDEETCETWRRFYSDFCGEENICIRSHIQLIGQSEDQTVFYARIRNVTSEKRAYEEVSKSERRFRYASEQANIYAWEYDIATKEMRPCFRCIRDLGLPPLLKNYPEPVIDAGIIPQDYADMYRDWHRQCANGAKYLEAIIPLTVGRVPFHVRYTTEFDENGKPVKAYGSAAMVVDDEE